MGMAVLLAWAAGGLPSGWAITPAGKHITLTDLPLGTLPDGKRALVASSGFTQLELSLM
jgi:hypothetical protein